MEELVNNNLKKKGISYLTFGILDRFTAPIITIIVTCVFTLFNYYVLLKILYLTDVNISKVTPVLFFSMIFLSIIVLGICFCYIIGCFSGFSFITGVFVFLGTSILYFCMVCFLFLVSNKAIELEEKH